MAKLLRQKRGDQACSTPRNTSKFTFDTDTCWETWCEYDLWLSWQPRQGEHRKAVAAVVYSNPRRVGGLDKICQSSKISCFREQEILNDMYQCGGSSYYNMLQGRPLHFCWKCLGFEVEGYFLEYIVQLQRSDKPKIQIPKKFSRSNNDLLMKFPPP